MSDSDNSASLRDVQASADSRNIALDRVGVRGIRYPIQVLDRANGIQHTIGTLSMTVELPHHFKGTHMSRFMQVLNEHANEMSVHGIPKILARLRERLDADRSDLQVMFPFFMCKKAPVTKNPGMMEYQ